MRLGLTVIGYWWRSGPVPSLPHIYLIYSLTCVNIWSVIKRGFPLNFISRSPTEPSLLSPAFEKKKGVAIDHSGQADKYWPAVTSQSSRRLEAGPPCPSSGKQWQDLRWNQRQDVNRRQTLTSCRVLHLWWTSVESLGCRAKWPVNYLEFEWICDEPDKLGAPQVTCTEATFLATECRRCVKHQRHRCQ